MKKKYEAYIGVWDSHIHEIELTIELTDEEYNKLKEMDEKEYQKFMQERVTHKITDYSLNFKVPESDEFYKVEPE